jgi:hypothetical protein
MNRIKQLLNKHLSKKSQYAIGLTIWLIALSSVVWYILAS